MDVDEINVRGIDERRTPSLGQSRTCTKTTLPLKTLFIHGPALHPFNVYPYWAIHEAVALPGTGCASSIGGTRKGNSGRQEQPNQCTDTLPSVLMSTISERRDSGETFNDCTFPSRYSHSTIVLFAAQSLNETSQSSGHAGSKNISSAIALQQHALQGIRRIGAMIIIGRAIHLTFPEGRKTGTGTVGIGSFGSILSFQ